MKLDFTDKCIQYADSSSDNDYQFQLISSLLLKVNDALEVKELRTLGLILHQYLTKKIMLDHIFWQRSYHQWELDEEEILHFKRNLDLVD